MDIRDLKGSSSNIPNLTVLFILVVIFAIITYLSL
jgi:hypothetical protein